MFVSKFDFLNVSNKNYFMQFEIVCFKGLFSYLFFAEVCTLSINFNSVLLSNCMHTFVVPK